MTVENSHLMGNDKCMEPRFYPPLSTVNLKFGGCHKTIKDT